MTSTTDSVRRAFMTALTTLPIGGAAMASHLNEEVPCADSRALVAYFSRSGNTRVIAGLIHRALNTDLFKIQPATTYPEDYLATVEEARRERDHRFERALSAKVAGMASYDTIFLGFPIWGETVPPVVCAFLSSHDLSGKSLIPFITHGGYGLCSGSLHAEGAATSSVCDGSSPSRMTISGRSATVADRPRAVLRWDELLAASLFGSEVLLIKTYATVCRTLRNTKNSRSS